MPITQEDLNNIQLAIEQGGEVWENKVLFDVKRRIKLYYLDITDQQCCYCRRDLTDEFMMVIDIEHILPKKRFTQHMFDLFNLSVSCKRCNMKIKGDNIDFLLDHEADHFDPQNTLHYLIVHPNFDNYFENIEYTVVIKNNKKSIKYVQLSDKGLYTYKYFQLEKLEVETLNKAQGIDTLGSELSPDIPADIIAATNELLIRL